MNKLIILFSILIFVGCATTPGTKAWYKKRLQEIETAHGEGSISEAEYISLKNEADQVRATK